MNAVRGNLSCGGAVVMTANTVHVSGGPVGLLLDNRSVENRFDHPLCEGSDFPRSAQEAVQAPVGEEELDGGCLLCDGGTVALPPKPDVRRDPSVLAGYLGDRLSVDASRGSLCARHGLSHSAWRAHFCRIFH